MHEDVGRDRSGPTSAPAVGRDHGAANVRVFGHEVEATFRRDEAQAEYRLGAALGALTEPDALRALMELPANLPVPAVTIDPLHRLVLDELPRGVVEQREGQLVRRVWPPVDLVCLAKRVYTWEDVQKLSLLRTHAPRLAVANRGLANRIMRTCDPDLGVAVVAGGRMQVERSPGRRWVKPSWQQWLVAETVFAFAGGVSRSRPATPERSRGTVRRFRLP